MGKKQKNKSVPQKPEPQAITFTFEDRSFWPIGVLQLWATYLENDHVKKKPCCE